MAMVSATTRARGWRGRYWDRARRPDRRVPPGRSAGGENARGVAGPGRDLRPSLPIPVRGVPQRRRESQRGAGSRVMSLRRLSRDGGESEVGKPAPFAPVNTEAALPAEIAVQIRHGTSLNPFRIQGDDGELKLFLGIGRTNG